MKILIRILAIVGFITFTASCDEQLDVFPKDKLYADAFFKTENEIRLYSNNFYIDLLPGASSIYGEGADVVVLATLEEEVNGQRTIPASGGGWNFSTLRDINFYLENSHRVQDESVKLKYNGLAKFFRAYFYFDKVKRFGDVPWYNRVLGSTDPELYKPRDSRQLVMDSIINDLNFAIENLPAEKKLYHVTKWTALALKSRIGLFEGTFRKYHGIEGYEQFLDYAIEASQELMTNSGYTVFKTGSTPYMDLFASLDANSTEIILARDYDATLSLIHNVQNYQNTSSMGKPGLAKSIVNTYLMADGSRFTDIPGYETMQFNEECANRDPRLAQTIRTPGYKRKGATAVVSPNLASTMTGYHLIKYTMETVYDDYNKSCNDMPIFRLGEVLLNYAEAKAERGTLTQTDLDNSVNLLRKRVNMPDLIMANANANPDPYLTSAETGYPNVNGTNKGVILEIRRERTIELVAEGHRYYDIIRWKCGKRFEKPMLGIYIPGPGNYDLDKNGKLDVCFYEGDKPAAFVPLFLKIGQDVTLSEGNKGFIICHSLNQRVWDENKDYFYPIPIKDRTLTEGALTQNPGWNDGLNY